MSGGALGGAALMWGAPALAVAGVAAVSLPVLIHLLLRRRRLPREWAAMDLLREALRRVERRRRLERWLLLALRCLLVALVGLAIAQPIIGASAVQASVPRTLVVVLDDGIASAERLADDRTALEWAAAAARRAIEALGPADRVAVVLASESAAGQPAPASLDHRGAVSRVTGAQPTAMATSLPNAIERAARILEMEESKGSERRVLVASAFREGSVGAMPPLPALRAEPGGTAALEWTIPPAPAGSNLQLAALEPQRAPGEQGASRRQVRATVRRDRGDGEAVATLRVEGPSLAAPLERTVRLAAGERERTVDLALPERVGDATVADRAAVTASLGDDAQPMDNARAAVLSSLQRLRVGIVDRRTFAASESLDQLPPGEWISRALAPSDGGAIEVSTADPAALDARTLAALDALVVVQPQLLNAAQWELIGAFVGRGGTAVVTPAAGERVQAWFESLRAPLGVPWSAAMEAVELEPPQSVSGELAVRGLLAAISSELPELAPSVQVSRVLAVNEPPQSPMVDLSLQDGRALVLSWRPEGARGRLVLLTTAMDLAWTTLPVKPLMVPLWQEVVSEGARLAAAARQVQVGELPRVERAGVVELRLVGADGQPTAGARAIPVAAGGAPSRPIERPGVYELLDGGSRVVGSIAAVVNDRAASVRPSGLERLEAWLGAGAIGAGDGDAPGAAGPGVRDGSGGSNDAGQASRAGGLEMAVWLLAAALVVAVAESLCARAFSHASVRARHAPGGGADAAGGAP